MGKTRRMVLSYTAAALIVAADQILKYWVRENIPLGTEQRFLPGFCDLTYIQNTGAAFGVGAGQTLLLTIVSLVAAIALTRIISGNYANTLGCIALPLLLGGAVGNLIDRALAGFVTDMFSFSFVNFPVFNIADIGVTAGAVFLILAVLYSSHGKKEN